MKDLFEKVEVRLDNIDKTLIKQEENLREHMRRTDLLEKEVAPIKSHVDQMRGAAKLIALASLIAGILAALGKVL